MDNTVNDHERRIISVEQFNNTLQINLREMCERTAKMEARSEDIVKSLDRITNMLEAKKK